MFVSGYIGAMPGCPDYLQHAPHGADTITVVDLIFPGFLFMVGIAIPHAVRRRMRAGESPGALLLHVIKRSAVLLLLGMVMYDPNQDQYSEALAGISAPAWYLLFYCAVIVSWSSWPPALQEKRPELVRAVRWGAAALAVALLAVFRAYGPQGEPRWFALAWGEPVTLVILDIIAWTYLFSALIYLLLCRISSRAVLPSMIAVLLGCTAFYCAFHAGWLAILETPWFNFPKLFGSLAIPVVAGVVTGQVFLEVPESRRRVLFLLLWAAALLALGAWLRPWQGASKGNSTASYALLSAGCTVLGFLAFFLVVDILRQPPLTAVLLPMGANSLLAYLLPIMANKALQASSLYEPFWDALKSGGLPAAALTLAMVGAFMLLLSWTVRWRVVLRL